MKRLLSPLIAVIMAAVMFYTNVYAAPAVPETNLDGVRIYAGFGIPISASADDGTMYVQYADGAKEKIHPNYIALFINGSIIKNSNLVLDKDRTLLPLRLISETLGAKVSWSDKERKVTIEDGGKKIELIIGDMNPKVNGKPMSIDAAPKIYNDYTYVPVRFVAEALGCKVDWFGGKANVTPENWIDAAPHYFYNIPQVMVSRYPQGAAPMSKEKAVETAKTQIIKAYENIYGKYTPLDPNAKQKLTSEADIIRDQIARLAVVSENDRYYIMKLGWEFWVDKYTGSCHEFYNGNVMKIWRFDPANPNALTFAG